MGAARRNLGEDLPAVHRQQRERDRVQSRSGRDKGQLRARNPDDRQNKEEGPANCQPACVISIRIFFININIGMPIGEKQTQQERCEKCSFMHLSEKYPDKQKYQPAKCNREQERANARVEPDLSYVRGKEGEDGISADGEWIPGNREPSPQLPPDNFKVTQFVSFSSTGNQ